MIEGGPLSGLRYDLTSGSREKSKNETKRHCYSELVEDNVEVCRRDHVGPVIFM